MKFPFLGQLWGRLRTYISKRALAQSQIKAELALQKAFREKQLIRKRSDRRTSGKVYKFQISDLSSGSEDESASIAAPSKRKMIQKGSHKTNHPQKPQLTPRSLISFPLFVDQFGEELSSIGVKSERASQQEVKDFKNFLDCEDMRSQELPLFKKPSSQGRRVYEVRRVEGNIGLKLQQKQGQDKQVQGQVKIHFISELDDEIAFPAASQSE